eukprot:4945659-Pyramimonas_sp.AAC.1
MDEVKTIFGMECPCVPARANRPRQCRKRTQHRTLATLSDPARPRTGVDQRRTDTEFYDIVPLSTHVWVSRLVVYMIRSPVVGCSAEM